MEKAKIQKYAELFARVGGNVQKGDAVVIDADTQDAAFARLLAESAYDLGAKEVFHRWDDSICRRLKYLRAGDEAFDAFPQWLTDSYDHFDAQKAVLLYIESDDPDLLAGVSASRVSRYQAARNAALKKHRELSMSNAVRWSIAAIPSPAWARKIFPTLAGDEAVEKLWQAIMEITRMNEPDPIEAWHRHNQNFQGRLAYLNQKNFRSLRYRNALGTDLTVEMPEGHLWLGGAEHDKEGVPFNPNIPTEEIFSAPKRDGVNGRVVSSMPLSYNGNLIENFEFTFQDGQAISFKAKKNEEILRGLLDNDGGARYLGEIALVPFDSPITRMGLLFYNTLFDENASCHFALGKGYPVCLAGSDSMSAAEVAKAGVNDSLIHVDFMVGTEDLSVIGLDKDGVETPVFVNGKFAQDKS
ncbi:MAG: aminopeptidase [Clostridiales bacterium]|jgi:aminopeptidase|nr:aminopeptidase [Clostridiales bacterium]